MKTKQFGQVRAFDRKAAEESRTIPFVFSTNDRDRHGTRLNQENWDLDGFNQNGIAGFQHNVYGDNMCSDPNPDSILGPARAWVEDGQLVGEIEFEPEDINPLAEKIFQKCLRGTLKSVSVGFIELGQGEFGKGEEARGMANETYYYGGQELLEISVVSIPSNKNAVRRSIGSQAIRAIEFVFESLDRKYSLGEIEDMKVKDVMALMDGKEPEKKVEFKVDRNRMKCRMSYLALK